MNSKLDSEYLWVEKYRPQRIEDTILPKHLSETFENIIKTGNIPNMLFTGTAGLGKTTVAKALCKTLDLDYIVINGSDEGRFIDTVRNRVKQFATTISLAGSDKPKVIIIDEADNTTPEVQLILRAVMEDVSSNCRFIFTCNFKNRITEPLHSRCSVYEFNTNKKDMTKLCANFFKRVNNIFEQEEIKFEKQDLINIILKHAPDWRRVLNEVQRRSVGGVLGGGNISNSASGETDLLLQYLKNKEFTKMRKWVANNIDADTSSIIRTIYDKMNTTLKPHSIPHVILILAEYQYKAAFVADIEINMVACLSQIMSEAEWL